MTVTVVKPVEKRVVCLAYESCDGDGRWKNAPNSGYWHFDLAAPIAARTEG